MRNFLVIKDGIVLDVVSKEGNFEPTDTTHDHDTLGEDPSGTFKAGDEYSVELLEQYNTPPKTLEQVKEQRKAAIDTWRAQAERKGLTFQFPNRQDVVQLRNERDLANVNGQALSAVLLKNQGVTGPVLGFRAESNTTHMLTPDQMIAMGLAVGSFVSRMYEIAWGLKEKVSKATTIETVEAVVWPE